MEKFCLFISIAMLCVACNSNSPTKAYQGVWEPIEGHYGDPIVEFGDTVGWFWYSTFYNEVVISSNKMVATSSHVTKQYEYHYQMLRDDVIELERTFLGDSSRPDYVVETRMYFDEDNNLIIENFSAGDLFNNYPPRYFPVKMKKK